MKTVFITGIGRGIGKALAEKFLNEGHAVIGTTQTGSADIAHQNVRILQLDLTSSASIIACAHEIAASAMKIDVAINNAGVLVDNDDTKIDTIKLRQTLDVNLFGTIEITERIIPLLVADAHIISVSSSAGSLSGASDLRTTHYPYHYPAYKISKAALNMYTRTLATRLAHEGTSIIVSSVHPGWVRTEMGGDEAPISPQQAAESIYALAMSRPETGQFWFNGEKYPW